MRRNKKMSDVDPLSGAYCKEHDIYLCEECALRPAKPFIPLVVFNRIGSSHNHSHTPIDNYHQLEPMPPGVIAAHMRGGHLGNRGSGGTGRHERRWHNRK